MANTQKYSLFTMNATALLIVISILNLIVSYLIATYVYSAYTIVPYYVLLSASFVGLEFLLYVSVVPMASLVDSIDKKKKRKEAAEAVGAIVTLKPKNEQECNNEDSVDESEETTKGFCCPVGEIGNTIPNTVSFPAKQQTKPQDHTQDDEVVISNVKESTHSIYVMSEEESRKKDAQIKDRLKKVIKYYVYEIMAPLLEEEDMDIFWLEMEGWLEKSSYCPKGRFWKWKQDVVVKPIDVRHLIWNIAKRMGMDKGYNVDVCAAFIKKMFPDICKNVRETTLRQTLKADPDKGYIKIDEPEPHNPCFHN